MLGRDQFARMKPDAVLINTARGPIVNEAALIEALTDRPNRRCGTRRVREVSRSARIRHLRPMDNVILTSHSIAWTEELFRDMGRIDCEGALAIYRGEVPAARGESAGAVEIRVFIEKLATFKAARRRSRRGDE